MSTAQKIIKNLAIAFAIFLIVSIITGILSALFGVSAIIGLTKDDNHISEELKNVELQQTDNSIRQLDIDVAYSNLSIKTGEKFLVQTNSSYIQCKQDGDKFKVKENKHKWFGKQNLEELVVYIPEAFEFEKVTINTGAGTVNIENIIAEKFDLSLGAGETKIKNLVSANTDIDAGAGKLTIESGSINDLDFDMGVGETEINAKVTGKSDIDAGVGSLRLNLNGKKEDYKIKVSKGIGSIRINGDEVSNDSTTGDGENYIEIDGGIGDIRINIQD